MLLQGLFVPLTCPFYRDGASYVRKLENNVARYSLGPVAGMVALPPGGESGALTDAEAEQFFKAVGESARKEKVLLAGVEGSSVQAVCERVRVAEGAGFDAVVLAPPPDWARLVRGQDARELLVFYEMVADRATLPLVLWSETRPPSLSLPLDMVCRLAAHHNVLGLLDADLTQARLADILAGTSAVRREVTMTTVFEAVTRRMLQPAQDSAVVPQGLIAVEALSGGAGVSSAAGAAVVTGPAVKTRTKMVGFQVLSAGAASAMVPLLDTGAAGGMPCLAACAPQGCFEAYAAWKDGDPALAAERGERLRAADALLERLGPAAVKAGCDFNGYFGGVPRLPRLPLTAKDHAEVERTLSEIRN